MLLFTFQLIYDSCEQKALRSCFVVVLIGYCLLALCTSNGSERGMRLCDVTAVFNKSALFPSSETR